LKVAISSKGEELSSPIEQIFGRAKWFIIADTETESFGAIPNEQNLNASQGAGIQSAAVIAREGVRCVMTGHCGPNAFKTLQSQGIQVVLVGDCTVREALEQFRDGKLKPVGAADVEGHWA
jgi:predicted Fe-Mo cluster-binding NifX family protein